jgi:hypothetical protein
VKGRLFAGWETRRWVAVVWTVVVIAIIAVLEVVIVITVSEGSGDDYIDARGLLTFFNFVGGFIVWGLGRGVIAAVAWFLDWRDDRRSIREARAKYVSASRGR